MFTKFLVPINPDDRDIASGIVAHATWLADRLASEVVFLSVIPIDRTEKGPDTAEIFERAKSDVELRLESLVESMRSRGVRLDTLVEFGSPAETIVETCRRLACDLIAMSTHGGGLLAQTLAGSVTKDVIADAPVPVLVVNPTISADSTAEAVDISRVYVALDGTPEAEAALPHVEFLAARLGFDIVLVRAVNEIGKEPAFLESPTASFRSGDGDHDGDEHAYAALKETVLLVSGPGAAAEQSDDYLDTIANDLSYKGLNTRCVLLEGDAKKCILGAFDESSHDMIAVTHNGRSGLRRRIAGSVSDGLIKKTGNPVLVVPTRVGAAVGA